MEGAGPSCPPALCFLCNPWVIDAMLAQPCFLLPGFGGRKDEPSKAQTTWVDATVGDEQLRNHRVNRRNSERSARAVPGQGCIVGAAGESGSQHSPARASTHHPAPGIRDAAAGRGH